MTESYGETIRAFLVDTFLLGADDGFTDDESLLDAGILDSTGVMELVSFLEERFGIAVADDEMVADNLDSVTRLVSFVAARAGSVPHPPAGSEGGAAADRLASR